ncbi:MAG: hypothetical protein R2774_10930 [Saprospiraceae bacterium]
MDLSSGIPFDFTAHVFGESISDTGLDDFKLYSQKAEKQSIDMEDKPNVAVISPESNTEGFSEMIEENPQLLTSDADLYLNVSEEKKKKKRKKSKSFKLKDFSGLSSYTKWLLSFDVKDLESKIEHSEEKRKRKLFKQSINKSVEKSNLIITEPLADVMAKQGHLDEAKKMYTHLMHKYPEKFSYFAAKIENLIK